MKPMPVHTDGGNYLGDVYQITVSRERVHKIFSRIAKALYSWKTQDKIPLNCDFSVEHVSRKQVEEDKRDFMETGITLDTNAEVNSV